MYVRPNFKTKKELVAAVKAGQKVSVFAPYYPAVTEGTGCVEGPHWPEPHRWYARVKVEGGYVVKVLS